MFALAVEYSIKRYTMYRQLQQKAKEYIIGSLCQISDKWKFDIDTTNEDKPVIVGYGPNGAIIRTPIEEFQDCISRKMADKIKFSYEMTNRNVRDWAGWLMLRYWLPFVFEVYGINSKYNDDHFPLQFIVQCQNNIICIASYIFAMTDANTRKLNFMSPFSEYTPNPILKEHLVSPLLLLLDPIKYFRMYSIIINKYSELNKGHTLGIYELLLDYFPDVSKEWVEKCWLIQSIFWELSTDVAFLVYSSMIDLL